MSLYSIKKSQQIEFDRKECTLPEITPFLPYKEKNFLLFHKETPRCSHVSGVFTVEAAIILPLLACFFVSLLFFFRVMQIEIAVQKALNDTGRQLAVYQADEESVLDIASAQVFFLKELGEKEVPEEYIQGGKAGISLLKSSFSEREVQLTACYQVSLPIQIFGVGELAMEQRADCRKWNGWNAADGKTDTEEWVYITETGSVYHSVSTCSYLNLSIRSVAREQLESLRNESGGVYRSCELCANQTNACGNVYITNQGNCYHNDLRCSGLKRTVYMIRLSEAGGRSACSRCVTSHE